MKTFTFSSYGVQSQTFKNEFEIASAKLAEEMDKLAETMDISVEDLIEHLPLIVVMMTKLAEEDISVEEVEAMTEEEVKAYVKKNMSASLLEAHNCVKILL